MMGGERKSFSMQVGNEHEEWVMLSDSITTARRVTGVVGEESRQRREVVKKIEEGSSHLAEMERAN